jgi:hypothetical protein
MSRAIPRISRLAERPALSHPCSPLASRTEFYRQEFLRHQRCLEQQREYFSEQAIHSVEIAIHRILGRLDTLCGQQDCDRVIGELLKKFDLVTRLSAWDEPSRAH